MQNLRRQFCNPAALLRGSKRAEEIPLIGSLSNGCAKYKL